MKHFILFISLCALVIACDSEEKNSGIEKKPVKVVLKKKKPKAAPIKKKPNLITDENVVERLTTYGKKNPETVVDLYTTKGKIRIQLYEDTPLHRANFILLVKSGYLDGCLFSRVVKDFMAQCGGSYDEPQKRIQDTIGSYTIPAEISKYRFHKKGTLGSARDYNNNPKKRSRCDEFYLVEGTRYSDITLDHYAELNGYTYSGAQRSYYKKNRGAAHIDGQHTIFGVIIQGYNVVSKLTHVETDSRDWPNIDMYIDSAKIVR